MSINSFQIVKIMLCIDDQLHLRGKITYSRHTGQRKGKGKGKGKSKRKRKRKRAAKEKMQKQKKNSLLDSQTRKRNSRPKDQIKHPKNACWFRT